MWNCLSVAAFFLFVGPNWFAICVCWARVRPNAARAKNICCEDKLIQLENNFPLAGVFSLAPFVVRSSCGSIFPHFDWHACFFVDFVFIRIDGKTAHSKLFADDWFRCRIILEFNNILGHEPKFLNKHCLQIDARRHFLCCCRMPSNEMMRMCVACPTVNGTWHLSHTYTRNQSYLGHQPIVSTSD